jgi:hypothetical protein
MGLIAFDFAGAEIVQDFSGPAPTTAYTNGEFLLFDYGSTVTKWFHGIYEVPSTTTATNTYSAAFLNRVSATTYPGNNYKGERRVFNVADYSLITFGASEIQKMTSSGGSSSLVPTTSGSGTSTYFTTKSTTRSKVIQSLGQHISVSTSYRYLQDGGTQGAFAQADQIGPVTRARHSVYLNNDALGILYTKHGVNFCDQAISFVSSSTYEVTQSYEYLPLIVKNSSQGPFTESMAPATFTLTYYLSTSSRTESYMGYTTTASSEEYTYESEGITYSDTSSYEAWDTYWQTYSQVDSTTYAGTSLPPEPTLGSPERWPANTSSSSQAPPQTLPLISETFAQFWNTVRGNITYAAVTYNNVTFSLPNGQFKTAYFSKASTVGYTEPDVIIDIPNYSVSGQKTSSVSTANTLPPYNSNSFLFTNWMGGVDIGWNADVFSWFGIEPKSRGFVSPDGGFATRAASAVFTGQIPNVTLSYPHVTARHSVLVPMPLLDWTTTVTGSLSGNMTSVQVSWGGGAFHYTTTAGTSTGSGSMSYAPTGSIPTTIVPVPHFYETSKTLTAYMPQAGVLMVSQGTSSSKTSFTCATTSTYDFSKGGAVMEFVPAIYGPTLSVIPKYVYTE